jgi:glucose-1-phosphate cytidylyltransferase
MKVVILCGGKGTRLREETEFKPKPLVEIGGRPILWHIMKIYSHYGYKDFILCLGYKGDMIKDYFLRQRIYANDFSLNTETNKLVFHNDNGDGFKVTFVDTGQDTLTGERLRRVAPYLDGDENFMVTYGDGVGDVNLIELLKFHKEQNTIGTITGVRLLTRFGVILLDGSRQKVTGFHQSGVVSLSENAKKLQNSRAGTGQDYINGGFMVFKKEVFDFVQLNSMIEEVFVPLSEIKQLSMYSHPGGWKCMDTHRDMEELNSQWAHEPFWKVWKDEK